MALPTISSPKYTLQIPSTKKTVEYRPFLVKEEKILLIAQESGDNSQIIKAMKDVVSECTFSKVNVDSLTSFDLEYIFIKLRTKSVGENSNINIKCDKCSEPNEYAINLDEIEVDFSGTENSRIMITDTVGVNMKYVSVADMEILSNVQDNKGDLILNTVIASIDSIFDSEKIYPTSESTTVELETFINSLNRTQMAKIEKFIATIPKLQHTASFKCSSCKCENSTVISGAQSFF